MMANISAPNVNYVQIDSLVVMKIVKHVDSELYAGMSEVCYRVRGVKRRAHVNF